MAGENGRPLAETTFRWANPDFAYWKDRSFALRAGIIRVVRVCAEPFFYEDGTMRSWRSIRALEVANLRIDCAAYKEHRIEGAIVCPVHSPFGVIGAVVWAMDSASVDVASVFEQRAADLQILALKFLSVCRDTAQPAAPGDEVEFTRREIQCLKWAAAGKTDKEIATIMSVSVPTIRFHLTNVSRKLGVSGRAHAIRLATSLGCIGPA